MPGFNLSDQELQNLLQILMNTRDHPWVITHPLIVKLGQQGQALARGNSHGATDASDEKQPSPEP